MAADGDKVAVLQLENIGLRRTEIAPNDRSGKIRGGDTGIGRGKIGNSPVHQRQTGYSQDIRGVSNDRDTTHAKGDQMDIKGIALIPTMSCARLPSAHNAKKQAAIMQSWVD